MPNTPTHGQSEHPPRTAAARPTMWVAALAGCLLLAGCSTSPGSARPTPSATQQTAAQLAADVASAVQLTITASGLSPWLTDTKADNPDAPAWTTARIYSNPCYVGAPRNVNSMQADVIAPATPDPVGVAARVVAAWKAHGYKTGYMGPATGTGGAVHAQGIAPDGTSLEFDLSAEGGGVGAQSVCSTDKSLHY